MKCNITCTESQYRWVCKCGDWDEIYHPVFNQCQVKCRSCGEYLEWELKE